MAEDDYHVFYRFKDSESNVIGRQAQYSSKEILEEL